jgi:hypothetical protein
MHSLIKGNAAVTKTLSAPHVQKVSWLYCSYGAIFDLCHENFVAFGGELCMTVAFRFMRHRTEHCI